MRDHQWAVLVAFPITLAEAVRYEESGDFVDEQAVPADLLQRDPEWGHVGCLTCSRTMHDLGEQPCQEEE